MITGPVIRTGVVDEFDEPRGLGTVRGDDGRRAPFHCTALVDGTRTIEIGVRVVYVLVPAHQGRLEARAIVPASVIAGPVV